MMKLIKAFGLLFVLLISQIAAGGSGITYHGRLVDPSGHAVIGSNVQFRIQLRTPGNENCLLYEEIQAKDLSQTEGVFAVTINDGSGVRTDTSGYSIDQIFANRGSFTFAGGQCTTGSTYGPNPTDGRKIQVYFNDGVIPSGQWEAMPSMAINFVPMSIESQQIGGYKKEQLIKVADGVNTSQTEFNTTSWTDLLALIAGTSNKYVKPTDQVTQLHGATVPAPANGQSIRWNTTLNAGSGGWENFTAGSASGTVTSVGLSAPSEFSVSGSPVTSTGTLGLSWANQTTNKVLASPNGSTGAPAFRALVSTDIPGLAWSHLTSGVPTTIAGYGITDAITNGGTTPSISSGLDFGRPAAGTSGRLYIAYDASKIYRDNGATWDTVSSHNTAAGDIVNGGNTTSATVTIGTNDAQSLALETGGTTKMTILNSGNVGIGTTSPAGNLHVKSATGGAFALVDAVNSGDSSTFWLAKGGASYLEMTSGAASNQVYITNKQATGALLLGAGNTTGQLTILSGGNVGIGTTAPDSKIHITSASSSYGAHFTHTASGGSFGYGIFSEQNGNSSSHVAIYGQSIGNGQAVVGSAAGQSGWSGIGVNGSSSGTSVGIGVKGSAIGANNIGYAVQAVNDSATGWGIYSSGTSPNYFAGNVGIGTTTPSSRLYVVGNSYLNAASAFQNNCSGCDAWIDVSNQASTIGGSAAAVSFNVAGNRRALIRGIGSGSSGEFAIETSNVGATAERLRVDSVGNVGIGTTSPGARLEVADAGTTTSAIIVPRAGNFTGTTVNGMIRYNTTSTLFEFYQNGAWVNYTTVSDGRLKTNVVPVVDGLNIVSQLNPVFYDWDRRNPKATSFEDKHQVGFIAQEVEKVLPEVVNKGEDSYRSLEYGKIVAVTVAAIKELYQNWLLDHSELEKLKQENAQMKAYLCAKDPMAPMCR